jgi:hypothetical protein
VPEVSRAIERLRKAQVALERATAGLLRVAEGLGDAAVERFREQVIHELLANQYPRDLVLLREIAPRLPPDAMPSDLGVPHPLADSMLRWLEERFGIAAHLQPGQELEIPVARLSRFEVEEDVPPDSGQLVRVRVLQPGWRVKGRELRRPHVEIVS